MNGKARSLLLGLSVSAGFWLLFSSAALTLIQPPTPSPSQVPPTTQANPPIPDPTHVAALPTDHPTTQTPQPPADPQPLVDPVADNTDTKPPIDPQPPVDPVTDNTDTKPPIDPQPPVDPVADNTDTKPPTDPQPPVDPVADNTDTKLPVDPQPPVDPVADNTDTKPPTDPQPPVDPVADNTDTKPPVDPQPPVDPVADNTDTKPPVDPQPPVDPVADNTDTQPPTDPQPPVDPVADNTDTKPPVDPQPPVDPSDTAGTPTATASADGMLRIEPGTFTMGHRTAKGNPTHSVTLKPFWIDRTEVTQAEYRACVTEKACKPSTCWEFAVPPEPRPIACVTWAQAQTYCEWKSKRLPTEAEWERAARGATDQRLHPWGDEEATCEYTHYGRCGKFSKPVDSMPKDVSPEGAVDMGGNVAEWTADIFGPLAADPATDPIGATKGKMRVLKGGHFEDGSHDSEVSRRRQKLQTTQSKTVGFRCARDAE